MVNLPPPESNDRPPTNPVRDKDEAIAVAIAFLAIGAILLWGWSRGQRALFSIVNTPPLLEESLGEDTSLFGLDDAPAEATGDIGGAALQLEGDNDIDTDRLERARDRDEQQGLGSLGTRSTTQAEVAAAASGVDPDLLADPNATGTAPTESETTPGSDSGLPTESAVPSDSEAAIPPPLDISDVSEDYWAYPYIVSLYEKGLLPDFPSGQLQPDRVLTRAEFAALLNSSFVGEAPTERDLQFNDVDDGFWAADAIRQVVDAGYMTGFPDSTFQPSELVPRYQVFVTLATGLDIAPTGDVGNILSPFQGADELPDWSRSQVAAAAEKNLIVNNPDPKLLEPQEPATRGEIIVMLHQALLAQGRVDPIESPYIHSGE